MPVSAARWMAAIVGRSKVADSRRPEAGAVVGGVGSSVARGVVDVEVVQLARRAVARVGSGVVAFETRRLQQVFELLMVLAAASPWRRSRRRAMRRSPRT